MMTSIICRDFSPEDLSLDFPHSALVNAVFQEPDCQSENSAGRQAREALQNPLCDEVGRLLDIARSVDHGPDARLKEIAANRTSHGADYGVAKNSEAVFLRSSCSAVSTDNAGDDLNNEICNRPGHRSPAVVGVHASAKSSVIACVFFSEGELERSRTLPLALSPRGRINRDGHHNNP